MKSQLIALVTDFGTEDGYVGAVKGRILSSVPGVQIVDITHSVEAFNIRQGAFCINNCYPHFPDKTVFVGVVDPGVGTRRRGIVVKSSQHYFIGPDNGLFSFVFNREGFRAYEILADTLPESISPTFHGRDIFAPVAAWIAAGKDVRQHLKPVVDVINFIKPPLQKSDTRFQLEVLHVDHFGNIILNFHRNDWLKAESLPNISVKIKDVDLKNVSKTFGSAAEGEIVLLWDSSDYLQIACNQGNAAQIYGIKTGDPATLHL